MMVVLAVVVYTARRKKDN